MTAAAERLRVTQPFLSQRIGTLEKHLGVQLLTRTPERGDGDGGRAGFPRGGGDRDDRIPACHHGRPRRQRGTCAANGELAGELIMAVHMGLGARQLSRALGQLRHRHPKLQVTLHEEPDPTDMERLVRQGTLDMVLVHRVPAGCTFDIHPMGFRNRHPGRRGAAGSQ
jgi:DNA-binding transcriptional LysR family regulator